MKRILPFLIFLSLLCYLPNGVLAQKPQKIIDSLLIVLQTAQEDTNKVKVLNDLAWQFRTNGDIEKAKAYSDTSIFLSRHLNYKFGNSMAYNLLGLLDEGKGNYESAFNNFYIALKLNEEIGNQRGMSSVLSNIGTVYWAQSNYPEALKAYKSALTISEESGAKGVQMSLLNNIGSLYGAQGNYAEALNHFLATLKLARELGNKYAIGISLKNIGGVYSYEHNYSEALNNYKECLTIMDELGNKEGVAIAYNALGGISQKQENYKEALQYISHALQLYLETGNKSEAAQTYHNRAIVLSLMDNYTAASEDHFAALELREEIGHKSGIAESKINIGNVLTKQAGLLTPEEATLKYNEAIGYIKQGLSLAREVGEIETGGGAYKALATTYAAMNDYKNALDFNQRFVELKDSLMNNETTRKLEQLRTQYEVEKAVAEEKVLQEKTLTEQNAIHQLVLTQEQAKKEKAIAIEKLKYDFALATEKTLQQQTLNEQKFKSEQELAEENTRHQLALADEKADQEKDAADRKRRAEILLLTIAMLSVIALFILLFLRQRNLKRKALEKAETIHKMAELELQSLRAQLNPHFMFNSLNAIQELILMEENDKSHTYLARFAKLLRMLLENANSPFIPLARELEFLELYLSLEKLRIPQLKYNIQVDPKINTEQVRIPNMILQPYIENAIWHGLSHKKDGEKNIQLSVLHQPEGVKYEIEDNGVGRKKAAELKSVYRKEHRSKGMELLTKRFKLLNEEYRFEITTDVTDLMHGGEATGTMVTIQVPWEVGREVKLLAS